MKKLDLIGRRFAKLVVLKEHPERRNGHVQWECICDCGTKSIVQGVHLVSGHTQTCGCSRMKHLQTVNVTHGMSKTGLYHIWSSMKSRCYYKKNASFYRYGRRGISVCREWEKFENFYEWAINNGYKPGLSIDRIDNNGNYEPSNCKWSTIIEQANNMSNNKKMEHNGKTKTIAEWCRVYGMKRDFAYRRAKKGLTMTEIIMEHEKI